MNNLKPLVWIEQPESFIDGQMVLTAQGAGINYRMMQTQHCVVITWHNQVKGTTGANESYKTFNEAQAFVSNTHYPHFMSEFVLPDSISDIQNWFKKAKPEPTFNDYITQLGCHVEEIAEMALAMGAEDSPFYDEASIQAEYLKGLVIPSEYIEIQKNFIDTTELLDALCDQIVTATGVAYMMGFDIEGALKEVIRSNNSKIVKGKFEYDENGKIAKPESYSGPDLKPFVSKQGE